ncbi:L,D-transpeptidase [Sphingomonas glacialis]|uniref:L,D-transpeptidase n=1 Tax=Sphingomonas glacialis TaxID=658225 RepID=UPI0019D56C9B|nr:L,D-transpeptidase [Sphingomonas glacialis]
MPRTHIFEKVRVAARQAGLVLAIAAWIPGVAASAAPGTADGERLQSVAPNAQASSPNQASAALAPLQANFLSERPSPEARRVADWAVGSRDAGGLPFVVIDKVSARVFVFEASGVLRGASTALFGLARGDDSVPGIGSRKLSTIRPEERTTPAGRFVAELGRDFHQDILWIDYDAALSLHRVVTGNPGDRRQARLLSPLAAEKRISYGCINVPAAFYDGVVLGAFTGTNGIVYILPEQHALEDVFRPLRTWPSPPAPAPPAPAPPALAPGPR